jgi:hypothetical protein
MAVKKIVTKKMQVGGAAKKAMKTVPVKKTPVKEPKGQFIGGPDYPSKGMLYNDANRIATSKYFTPDGIRKTDKTLKAGTIGMAADIGLNTELTAKKFMKANNMGKDGLPIKSKSKPKAKYGVSVKPSIMRKGGAKKK